MAKAHRVSDVRNIRIFKTEHDSELVELDYVGFEDESQLHKLTENNIRMLFHNLKFLKSEYRKLDGGKHIPDTVAFDEAQNTFVAIEYKNKRDKGVIDQAKTYLKYMKRHKPGLVMEYLLSTDTAGPLNSDLYGSNVYAIVMVPKFEPNQIEGNEDDKSLELYEVRRYGSGILMMERVGGSHKQTPATARHNDPPPDTGKLVAVPRLKDMYTKLPDIEYVKGMRYPQELTCPDGSRVDLGAWTGILAGVANWLVTKGYLGESHCPVPIGRSNAILNTRPFHQNGKRFRYSREVGHLHVYLNVNPVNSLRYSIKLIEIAELSPSEFKVSFDSSARPTRPPTPPSPMSAHVTISKGSSAPGCEETNECYVPHAITIGVGEKVVWTNDDQVTHTVTSGVLTEGGPDGIFDSGLFVPGDEFSHVFEDAGEYPYFDLVHPWMKGMVIVRDV